jgi:RsiW-degrading membrane proteinase PrsW (M82 family)
MKTTCTILFFTAIAALLICEFFFLRELHDSHRWYILAAFILGGLIAGSTIFLSYRLYNKETA